MSLSLLLTFSRANQSIKAEKRCSVVERGHRESALQPPDQQGHLIALCIMWQLATSRKKSITLIDKSWMGRFSGSQSVTFFLKLVIFLIQCGYHFTLKPSGKSIFNTFCESHRDFGFPCPLIKEMSD